jgi:hypothetical protein
MKLFKITIIVFLLFLLLPYLSLAAGTAKQPDYQLQVPIFGYTKATNIAEYIKNLYKYALYALVPIAIIIIIYAGIIWILAGGNISKIKEAKKYISSAVLGLFIALLSYVILSFVGITELKPPSAEYITPEYLDYAELMSDTSAMSGGDFREASSPPTSTKKGATNIVSASCETLSGTKSVQVDQSIKAVVEKTCKDVKSTGFKITGIGGYRNSPLCHGRGLAIDLNVTQNYCVDCYEKKGAKVGSYFRPGVNPLSLNQAAVQAFKNNGWCWAGDWSSLKDYMHFSINCNLGHAVECNGPGRYDWSKSAEENQKRLGITWP